MKALTCLAFGPIENVKIVDMPSPQPGPRQLLIEVKAAAVNFPDVLLVQGLYQMKPPLPFVPGGEISGIVKAVGAEVTRFKPGDAVFAGAGSGFAELCVADEQRCHLLPAGASHDMGAGLMSAYGTSLHALQQVAELKPGETLVVLGAAGGVGLAAVELGKLLGARVIAAASSDDKLALCSKSGADATINYSTESLKDRINQLTEGRGADVIYDPVGGKYAEPALRALAWRGRFLVVGFAAGDIPKIPINLLLLRERKMLGVYWGDAVQNDPQGSGKTIAQLNQWFGEGKIKPLVSQTFPLERGVEALQLMANRGALGKIVIRPNA